MTQPLVVAAVDLGASGGRVVRGVVSDDEVTLEVVHRFANGVIDRDRHLRWDADRLRFEVDAGLAAVEGADSIGIDTWGVDYGLLGHDGELLDLPIAYRDDRTAAVVERVHALVPPDELYAINGLQHLPFTTLFQLGADRRDPVRKGAAQALLLPDLISYWLTGELATEITNASTTGLVDASSRSWSTTLFDRLGIAPNLFPALEEPGTRRGSTASGVPVTVVGSHDTASAVVGVPATSDRFAYVISGTWSLVGLERPAPVLTDEAQRANFSNEAGVGGRVRFLRNVGGLWLLQECLRAWRSEGDLDRLVAAAAELTAGGPQIDVDDPRFIAPGAMPGRIAAAAGDPCLSPAAITRCILDSLAAGYARTIEAAISLTGATVDVVHIVGGGSQNELLCQLAADAIGRPVLAGPVEATALGNVLVQARALGVAPSTLEGLRELVACSIAPRRYEPT